MELPSSSYYYDNCWQTGGHLWTSLPFLTAREHVTSTKNFWVTKTVQKWKTYCRLRHYISNYKRRKALLWLWEVILLAVVQAARSLTTRRYTRLWNLRVNSYKAPTRTGKKFIWKKLNYRQISWLFTGVSIKVQQNSTCVCVCVCVCVCG